jgi:hypothetical protein
MIVVVSGCAGHGVWRGNPNAPPPIKAEELRKQLMPGLKAVFGVSVPKEIVAEIRQV